MRSNGSREGGIGGIVITDSADTTVVPARNVLLNQF